MIQVQKKETLVIAEAAIRMYAESHPRPPHVTQSQAADMLKISRATVNRMVRSGSLRLNRVGLIPISEIDAVIVPRAL